MGRLLPSDGRPRIFILVARPLVTSLVLASGVSVPAVLAVDVRKLFDGSQHER
jgi:hypothetical protein